MCRVIVHFFCWVVVDFWLVVFGGVELVLGDDFSAGFVDDHDGVPVEQDQHWGVFVGSSNSEVEEFAAVAQADGPSSSYGVVSDSPDLVKELGGGLCFG